MSEVSCLVIDPRNDEIFFGLFQDKGKIRKSVVNQIVKYIREDPTVSSAVVKLPKPTRPKTTVAQSASSTLIRKAMADAHKSLTTSKEESLKVSYLCWRTVFQREYERLYPRMVFDECQKMLRDFSEQNCKKYF